MNTLKELKIDRASQRDINLDKEIERLNQEIEDKNYMINALLAQIKKLDSRNG